MRLASARAMSRSLRIQSTAKPKSNRPSIMVPARWSICQDWAAPLEMVAITAGLILDTVVRLHEEMVDYWRDRLEDRE